MPDELPQPVLILFAKSPVAGRAKTRLIPELSAEQAAQVAITLIEQTTLLAVRVWPGPVSLCTWPDTGHPVLKNLAREHQLSISVQSGADLGEKMFNALKVHTDQGQPAAILGCDVPHCPHSELSRAYDILRQGDNVIGPSRDGGYYLIGLTRPHPDVFHSIDWGSTKVLQQTLHAADRCGLKFKQLMALVDVDAYSDLQIVAKSVPRLRKWIK